MEGKELEILILKGEILDMMEKQGELQTEIRKIETVKLEKLEELEKLRNN